MSHWHHAYENFGSYYEHCRNWRFWPHAEHFHHGVRRFHEWRWQR